MDRWVMKAGLVDDAQLLRWAGDAIRRRLMADEVAEEYEFRKPRVERGIERKLMRQHGAVDDWRFRQEMGENWTLNDLIKKHAWHRDEAASLNLAIQTQLALRAALAAEEAKGKINA